MADGSEVLPEVRRSRNNPMMVRTAGFQKFAAKATKGCNTSYAKGATSAFTHKHGNVSKVFPIIKKDHRYRPIFGGNQQASHMHYQQVASRTQSTDYRMANSLSIGNCMNLRLPNPFLVDVGSQLIKSDRTGTVEHKI